MLRDHSVLSMAMCLGLASSLTTTAALPASAQDMSFYADIKSGVPTKIASSNTQYMVYVPGNDPALLQRVRAVAPDAFKGKLDSGQTVVQIGRYNNYNFAQRRADQLKSAGIQAEVTSVVPRASSVIPVATAAVTDSFSTPITGTNPSAPSSPPVAGIVTPPAQSDPFNALPGVPGSNEPHKTIDITRQVEPIPTAIPPSTSTATVPVAPPPIPVQNNPVPNNTVAMAVPPSTTVVQPNRYFVIIPSSFDLILQKAKTIVPTAKLTTSNRGTFIEVQGYPDRASAETLNATVRSQGLDSRVVYF